jgi:hypothetical protein
MYNPTNWHPEILIRICCGERASQDGTPWWMSEGTDATLHYTTLHYTTLHYTTLHYTTLHYTTLHYTTLHIRDQVGVQQIMVKVDKADRREVRCHTGGVEDASKKAGLVSAFVFVCVCAHVSVWRAPARIACRWFLTYTAPAISPSPSSAYSGSTFLKYLKPSSPLPIFFSYSHHS